MANSFLDPLLGWLLLLDPALAIIIMAFIVSIITTLAIKFLTNQSLMKDMKEELKELQGEMKDLRDNPKKLSKVNTRFMETNMKYMTHSMRPTLFTLIPLLLVFAWLQSNLAYLPLTPGEPFHLTAILDKDAQGEITLQVPQGLEIQGEATREIEDRELKWSLEGEPGVYTAQLLYDDNNYNKTIIITEGNEYAPVDKDYEAGFLFFGPDSKGVEKIVLSNNPIKPLSDVPVLEKIPWINTWGWLGVYILFSLIFSMSLRKIFNIY